MSIYYNITLQDKTRLPNKYVCFGLLNCLGSYNGDTLYSASRFYPENLGKRELASKFARDLSRIRTIEFDYHQSLREDHYADATRRLEPIYEDLMKQLIESFEMFRDTVSIHVKNKVVRVIAEGQPCDKVLFALSLSRNLLKWVGKFKSGNTRSASALDLLSEKIPDFKQRTIFMCLFEIYKDTAFSSTPNALRIKPMFSSEYSLINPATFGVNALRRLHNNSNDIDWFQTNFNESENGYFRDHHFASQRIGFPGSNIDHFGGRYVNSNARGHESYPQGSYIGPYLFRRLFDAISIPGDEPLFDFCEWNENVGFMWHPHNVDALQFDTDDVINKFLSLFED